MQRRIKEEHVRNTYVVVWVVAGRVVVVAVVVARLVVVVVARVVGKPSLVVLVWGVVFAVVVIDLHEHVMQPVWS